MSSNDKKNVVAFDAKKKPAKKVNGVMIGSVIILVLSAIVFVLVPALTGFRGTDAEAPVLGSYKGTEIKYEQGSDFVNYMGRYAQQVKDSGYSTDDYLYSILNSAFTTTVVDMAITDYVEASKYVVPEEAVNRVMRTYFTDENGNYSRKAYMEADKSYVRDLLEQTEEDLVALRYFNDFLGLGTTSNGNASMYGAKISSKEADFVSDLNADKRQFQMVSLNMVDVPEDEYKLFACTNPSIFEKFDYSICSADTQAEAEEILNLINNNQITFDDAVATMSTNAFDSTAGKLNLYNYQIKENLLANPDDYDAFVALGNGEISNVFHTQQGYAFFRRNGPNQAANLEDPAVMDVVGAYVRVYEKDYIEDYFVYQAKDFCALAARDGFEAAAESMGLEIVEPSAFPCNYGNDSVLTTIPTSQFEQLTGAEKNADFLKKAFSLKVGEVSEPILLDDYVVVLKYKEAVEKDEAVAASMAYMYPYYAANYAQASMQDVIMGSDDVKNDVMSFYFKNFLGYSN